VLTRGLPCTTYAARVNSAVAFASLSLLCAPTVRAAEAQQPLGAMKQIGVTELRALLSDSRIEFRERLTAAKEIWVSDKAPELLRRTAFQGLLALAQELDSSLPEPRTVRDELLAHIKQSSLTLISAPETPQELRALILRELGFLYQVGGREGADTLLQLYRSRTSVLWLHDPRMQAFLLLTCARAGVTEVYSECKSIATRQGAASELRTAAVLALTECADLESLALLEKIASDRLEPYQLRAAAVRGVAALESAAIRALLLRCTSEIPKAGEIELNHQEFLGVVFQHLADYTVDEPTRSLLASADGRFIEGSGPDCRLALLRAAWGDPSVLPRVAELAISCPDPSYQEGFLKAVFTVGKTEQHQRVLREGAALASPLFPAALALLTTNQADKVRPELRAALRLAPHQSIAKLLSALKDQESVAVLRALLGASTPQERLWITRTLVELGEVESMPALFEQLLGAKIPREQILDSYRIVAKAVADLPDEILKSAQVRMITESVNAASSRESAAIYYQGATEALAFIRSGDALQALKELALASNQQLRLYALAARARCDDAGADKELIRLAQEPETRQYSLVWKALTYCSSSASRRFLFTQAQSGALEPLNHALHAWTLRQKEDPTFAAELAELMLRDGTLKSTVWGMVNYATALKATANPSLYITNPFCVRPDTLWRLVSSAQATTFDARPLAAVIVGSEDQEDSFGRAELAIRPLLKAGYMVRFSQVSHDRRTQHLGEDGVIERLKWAAFANPEGKPRKQLEYVMFILHGGQRDAVLGPKTAVRTDGARRLDPSDEKALIDEGVRSLLKNGARGAFVACWSGQARQAATTDSHQSQLANLAQMLRRVWPQAAKNGFIAPRTAVQIELLDAKRNSMWGAEAELRY
jgi:hypothetical protein